jgi:hypothetical protein
MPDPHRVEGELRQLYSNPRYKLLLKSRCLDLRAFAKEEANKLVFENSMLNPVKVEELQQRGLKFYRAFDGRPGKAKMVAGYWSSLGLVQRMWDAAGKKSSGAAREELFMEFMRAGNFVPPEPNGMLHIARMDVPEDQPLVVIRARGDWRALLTDRKGARTSTAPNHPFDNPKIGSTDDVLYSLHMMPTPGEEQFKIPLYDPAWVHPVERGTNWPLA